MPWTAGTWEQDEVMPVAVKTSVSLMDRIPEAGSSRELSSLRETELSGAGWRQRLFHVQGLAENVMFYLDKLLL